MSPKKIPAFEDYNPNFIPEAIDITMQELNLSREEVLKLMKETSYQVLFPKPKKRRKVLHKSV